MIDPLVLGIDVGTTRSGWALLAPTTRQGRARFISGGMVASDDDSILALLRDCATSADGWMHKILVAIEQPTGYIHEHKRGAHLMASRGVAGAVGMAAKMLGCQVVRLTAQQVRNAMCRGGRGTPGDAAVKQAVAMYVESLPSKSNTHVRDAILVACVALFNHGRIGRTG